MTVHKILCTTTPFTTQFMLVLSVIGNNQKRAKALIEASGLRMLAVEDFDMAAKTVSMDNMYTQSCKIIIKACSYRIKVAREVLIIRVIIQICGRKICVSPGTCP